MAAQGTASPAIAAALGLSPRTVENHITRIYTKLGINSRTQLARLAVSAPEQDASRGPFRPGSRRPITPGGMHLVTPAGMLAGRADELALLEGYLRELARGSGNAVLIEGEPGIGKTALVRAALSSASHGFHAPQGARPGSPAGCQVFRGAGDELGQELPLLPFLEALEVRAPSADARRTTIAGLLRGEVATDRGADVPALLAEQLTALIIDETRVLPLVLVIDDLHWADPASVKLWGRLARTAHQVPLLLIGVIRPVPQRDDLLALRRAVDDAHSVQLGSLSSRPWPSSWGR